LHLSPTLSIYIGRNFLVTFVALFTLFLMLIFLFDTVELLRRAAAKPEITITMIFKMALLKLPHMAQQVFPFGILFGGMATFWRLNRSHELVITRAAGVSVWQFLLPVLGIAFLLGLFQIGVISPLASTTITRYERIEAINLKGLKSFLALSEHGLWLRQTNSNGQSVVHSRFILQKDNDVELRDVIVFNYKKEDRFIGRLDAEKAVLEDGFWHLSNTWVHMPENVPKFEKNYWLATDLTMSRIQDSFAPPETMSFWELPEFITTLEDAGFTAVRHRLYWHALLSSPLMMFAMVLIAAVFTLRYSRQGDSTYVIGAGVLSGFALYFFSDIVFALGVSGSIPVTLAAWTPSGIATLLGLATLLHFEDG
jgi:lipopolysaccharide export system permease protein